MSKEIIKRSQMAGVSWEADRKCWRAYLVVNGKRVYLGRRKTMEEAEALRLKADQGILPSAAEKRSLHLDKMARIRMRSVWRELPKGHVWETFDQFLATVGDRPPRQMLAATSSAPMGPDNFQWIAPKFDRSTKDGRNSYNRAHYAANVDRYRDKQLQKDFGITLEEYRGIMDFQDGCCAICDQPETAVRKNKVVALAVDHDHRTGQRRGLLCTACNIAIGSLGDDYDRIIRAALYIKQWKAAHERPLPDNVILLKGA